MSAPQQGPVYKNIYPQPAPATPSPPTYIPPGQYPQYPNGQYPNGQYQNGGYPNGGYNNYQPEYSSEPSMCSVVGLCILSYIMPIVGWILWCAHSHKQTGKRCGIVATISFVLYLIIIICSVVGMVRRLQ